MTSVESLTKALKDFAYAVPEDVRNAALAVVADLSAERKRREEAERELAWVRGLPDLEWAQASAAIVQGLALHARTDQPAAKRMMEVFDKAKTYVERLAARAEQAEREVEEKSDMLETALSQRRAAEQERDDALAATERAEADNAALAEQLHHQWSTPDSPGVSTRSAGMLSVNHPGTALLERLRALESLYDACAAYFVHAAANHDTGCPEDDTCECPHVVRVNDAFSAVDALKEKP